MDKFFKRTLVCAAVASAAMAGTANAAIELNGQAVQFYGQAAGSLQLNNPEVGDSNTVVEIESRLGVRGTVEFDNFEPNFIYQMETGNAWNRGGNNDGLGSFGGRDTYFGFDFDGVGSIKFGRQLVAAYNYVDWPHSNPGLGNVFDWHNKIGASYQDRANDNIRFDSATWGGFNFQATLSGMDATNEAMVYSLGTSFTREMFSVHAGYYGQSEYDAKVAATGASWGFNKDLATCAAIADADKAGSDQCYGVIDATEASTKKAGDVSYAIVGGSLYLGDLTLTAAYKHMKNDLVGKKNDQDAYSATAQYVIDGKWVLKGGYAATSKTANGGYDDSATAITARLGYLLPSSYLYMDIRNYDMPAEEAGKDEKAGDATNILLGAEYYF
ncbi:outer membrane protein [Vibrio sp. N418]|uniref:porin n=1 Tax=Vibrio sp. (strain N418) TaxID=701176 RepID=UPI00021C0A68|nr:porin [Vibrio sp. N418]EGU31145.1 outer membrane protein [Vibrio sp. N418]